MALRCSIFHDNPEAQLCNTTSPPTAETQSSNSPMATDSSTGCTGVRLVTPVSRPVQRRRQRRFVELHHHRGIQPPGHLRAVGGHTLGQRPGQVAQRTGIGDGAVAAGQFQLRGQRDRAGRLHLHRARSATQSGPLPGLFERVDVLVEQAGRAPGHRAAARRDAIAAGHGVDADVDQQRAGAADDVGTDSAGRQLHQMRQRVQFADDHLGGLSRRRPGPRTDAGRCGENTHSSNSIR